MKLPFDKSILKKSRIRFQDWMLRPQTIAVAFIIIGLAGLIDGPIPYLIPGLESFHNSISPELVGIGVTVLIIDAVNDYHRSRTWKPTRNYIMAKLMRSLSKFLFPYTLPGQKIVLYYGQETVHIAAIPKELDWLNTKDAIDLELAALKIGQNQLDQQDITFQPLDELQASVTNILLISGGLIDQELSKWLFSLDTEIDEVQDLIKHVARFKDQTVLDKASIGLVLEGVIKAAHILQIYLLTQADFGETEEKYLKRIETENASFEADMKQSLTRLEALTQELEDTLKKPRS